MDRHSTFGPSERMQAVQTPIIPVVGDLIRQHPGTISLGQGVAYYGPPKPAIDRVRDFLSSAQHHEYGPTYGIKPLVDLIKTKLERENGITDDDAYRIVVTAGANMGFLNALFAITDPGDEIIVPLPYYFNQEMAIGMVNCKAVLIPTDDNYQPSLERIRAAITERTRAVVSISPNNPTGAVYPEAVLREINTICREQGIYHISDEAYENFTYNGVKHFSPGTISGAASHTISLFSLSKAYGFAGWRIGYMVIPEQLYMSVLKVQDTNLICPPVVSQYAAVGALEAGSEYCREKLKTIAEVRGIILNELEPVRPFCKIPPPDGAFYLLMKVQTEMNAMRVVEQLIKEYGVAVIPGDTFGM
ncbi:MAG: pyridoxal phosphate-dependent aminotransferase, partial [Gammaproteobacteria bacterium]|nr:pyridoxal phosphate-dependent aminotransferase [Gammaproteobacteria bacterium]